MLEVLTGNFHQRIYEWCHRADTSVASVCFLPEQLLFQFLLYNFESALGYVPWKRLSSPSAGALDLQLQMSVALNLPEQRPHFISHDIQTKIMTR